MIKLAIVLLIIISTSVSASEKLTCDKYDDPNIDLDFGAVRDDLQRKIDNMDTLVKELTEARQLLKEGIESEARWRMFHDLAVSTRLIANTTFAAGSVFISGPAVIGASVLKSVAEITNNAINARSQDEAVKNTLLDLSKQQIEMIGGGIANSLGKKTLEKSISGAFAAIDILSQFDQAIKDSEYTSTRMDPKQLKGITKQIQNYTKSLNALKKELTKVNNKLKENGLEKKLETAFSKVINKYQKQAIKSCEKQAKLDAENAKKINPPVIEEVRANYNTSKPYEQLIDIIFKDLDGDIDKISISSTGVINQNWTISKEQLSQYTALQQSQGVNTKGWIIGSCPSSGGTFTVKVQAFDVAGHSSNINETSWNCPNTPNNNGDSGNDNNNNANENSDYDKCHGSYTPVSECSALFTERVWRWDGNGGGYCETTRSYITDTCR